MSKHNDNAKDDAKRDRANGLGRGSASWRSAIGRLGVVSLTVALPLGFGAYVLNSGSAANALNGDDLCPNLVLNSGFEEPVITEAFANVDADVVPGWSSDGEGLMELWRSGTNGVVSPEGAQFAELDVNSPTAITQMVEAPSDGEVSWSIRHRGTDETDTLVLTIGTAEQTLSAPSGEWTTHTGTAEVSAGPVPVQIASSSPDGSVGNLIDDVSVRGLCDPPEGELQAVDDVFGDPEGDGSANGIVGDNDVIPAGAEVTFSVTRQPAEGYLQMWPDGHFAWVPEGDASSDFAYQVCLGDACSEATVQVQAVEVNEPPFARDDFQEGLAPAGIPFEIDVLANDDEGEPDNLDFASLRVVSNPTGVGIRVVADGVFEVQIPTAEDVANVQFGAFRIPFTYEICNLDAVCVTADVLLDGSNPPTRPES